MTEVSSLFKGTTEFVPTLIQTVKWEAWTWDALSDEIGRNAPQKLVKAIRTGDRYLVQRLLGLSSIYLDAIDDVLADLNDASGVVSIREERRREVILKLLEYIDAMYEQRGKGIRQ